MHGGVKFYRGAANAARAYVERDRSRADDYYLGEGTGVAVRLTATPGGVEHVGELTGDAYEVALCAFAGLRRGEALGVQVGDIDFLARTLRVSRQLQRAKPADIETGKNLVDAAGGITVMIRPPKYESERTIYLPDELVTILSEHVRQHTPNSEPTRWLFNESGKPWHDNLVDYRWRSTRTDAGVTYKLHELRHYCASGLIAAGCDVVTVQRAMGHASATTTLSTYAHLWPTAEDKTRAAASGMAAAVLATRRPPIQSDRPSASARTLSCRLCGRCCLAADQRRRKWVCRVDGSFSLRSSSSARATEKIRESSG